MNQERVPVPARDQRFTVVGPEDPSLTQEPASQEEADMRRMHSRADTEMQAAELCGRNIYEYPEMPWEFHLDMARQIWDEVRHAEICRKRLEAMGGHLGMFPVTPGRYAYRYQLDLPHRICDLNRRGELPELKAMAVWREAAWAQGDMLTAKVTDYLQADEVQHTKFGHRWIRHFTRGDRHKEQELVADTQQRWDQFMQDIARLQGQKGRGLVAGLTEREGR